MKCNVCGLKTEKAFVKKILNKYDVSYFRCSSCSFIQTEAPYWLEEAYSQPINISDTGYINRNLYFYFKLRFFFRLIELNGSTFLDYGAGYGVFVRMMRDIGFNYYWNDAYTQNLFCSGAVGNIGEGESYRAITAFEVVEHLEFPFTEIEKLLRNTEILIFSTELQDSNTDFEGDWWYLGLEHGQHISLFSRDSLKSLANQLNCFIYSIGTLHFLSKKKIPITHRMVLKLSGTTERIVKKTFNSLMWQDHKEFDV